MNKIFHDNKPHDIDAGIPLWCRVIASLFFVWPLLAAVGLVAFVLLAAVGGGA